MAQKFIVTQKGYFRLGNVRLHKELLQAGDVCYGGGVYRFDYTGNQLVLTGESFDFGPPQWMWLLQSGNTLKVPEAYRGMSLVYQPEMPMSKNINVSALLKIEYV